ncbi:MAG: ATP synthase F1 subunit delta [Acidobacteriota bacterium]
MSNETVARRYASALADVVTKIGDADKVKSELKIWEQLIKGNAELQGAFGNPAIAQADKVKVLEALIDRAKPTGTTANFLRVLLRNKRLTALTVINQRYEIELDERGGLIAASVASARELTEGEKAELRSNLDKLTGKKVALSFEVDKDIIGGVVTRVGSTVYDSSVRTQLLNLKEELANG